MSRDVVVLPKVTWTSPPHAWFFAMAADVEARFGPPSMRDADSNGIGLFDCHCLRFACGLEVALWRFHCSPQGRVIDPANEPSGFDVHANQSDLLHLAFHLEVPASELKCDRELPVARPTFVVMRQDDNGIQAVVQRVTSECEATAVVRTYEARGHKQTYWVVAATACTI